MREPQLRTNILTTLHATWSQQRRTLEEGRKDTDALHTPRKCGSTAVGNYHSGRRGKSVHGSSLVSHIQTTKHKEQGEHRRQSRSDNEEITVIGSLRGENERRQGTQKRSGRRTDTTATICSARNGNGHVYGATRKHEKANNITDGGYVTTKGAHGRKDTVGSPSSTKTATSEVHNDPDRGDSTAKIGRSFDVKLLLIPITHGNKAVVLRHITVHRGSAWNVMRVCVRRIRSPLRTPRGDYNTGRFGRA